MLLGMPVFLRAGLGPPSLFWLQGVLPAAMLVCLVPILGGFVPSLFRINRWAKSVGLSSADLSKLYDASDASPIWKKPHIQRLLLPTPDQREAVAPSAPKTPEEHVNALSGAARLLDGVAGQVAGEAASAGRDLLNAIVGLEKQIEDLARDADPSERERLEEKLAALGEGTATEGEGRRRMRDLLSQQVELAQSLAGQLEEAEERRSHLVDLLKTLWMQIANLKAHQHDAAFDSSEISGRIRAISDDAKRYVEATDETMRMLEGK
jgi:hypothetical protein